MELIERYLQAVEIWLPRSQRRDIIRELSDNIHSQVEEREEERGRPLTEADQAELLRQIGPPILLAS
ncbi:MAG: hypothetical protein HZB25_08205 [Candidatus Eisenbacteria bacterium]|nr:hypothetical protein [Candidatus Eisenbacteria bacterium]